jgi:hypothetical protein
VDHGRIGTRAITNQTVAAAKKRPVASSTTGYRAEITDPQLRHLPRSTSQDTTGILSYPLICEPQSVHALGGDTMDRWRGIRYATTLRNDPISIPNRPTKTASTLTAQQVAI